MDSKKITTIEIGKFVLTLERDYDNITMLCKEGNKKLDYFIYPDADNMDRHHIMVEQALRVKYREKFERQSKKIPKKKRDRNIPSRIGFKM